MSGSPSSSLVPSLAPTPALVLPVPDNQDDGTCEINVYEDGDITIVLDPIQAKTKGAPRKRLKANSEKRNNHCGMCNQHGHNIRSCPSISVNNVDKQDVNNNIGNGFLFWENVKNGPQLCGRPLIEKMDGSILLGICGYREICLLSCSHDLS
ncbi:uncharacterized protein A4U43_C04F6390 [Asparagus officinalis]|uniref:CCHC-type domain-containing protein n=1 Tax=Asparagus officinalis TaxID=4686 RepID=A0A5P1EZ69_ASPOF|nr:uncharacterized protein A4U43_C04F6390 [Asparagus officinalis]